MYQIKILPTAQKDLDNFPAKVFHAMESKIVILADNPRPQGAIKLTADEGYRIRIGDYRILYRIEDKSREVFIYRVKHRKNVYR